MFRRIFAKLCLSLAYLSALLQWLWVLLIGLPPLIQNGAFEGLREQSDPTPIVHTAPMAASPVTWVIIGVVTLAVLIVTVIVLIRVPRVMLQTSERMVQQTAEAVVPVITHHKSLPAKQRRIISRRVRLALQLLIALLPLIVCVFLPSFEELTRPIILTVAVYLAVLSLAGFLLAWLVEPRVTSRTRLRASRE